MLNIRQLVANDDYSPDQALRGDIQSSAPRVERGRVPHVDPLHALSHGRAESNCIGWTRLARARTAEYFGEKMRDALPAGSGGSATHFQPSASDRDSPKVRLHLATLR